MQEKEFRLDIIRIIALILVVVQHCIDRFVFENAQSSVWDNQFLLMSVVIIYQSARIAVPLFILLSGYLLLPRSTQYSLRNTLSFYKRRWNRIGLVTLVAFLWYFFWRAWWFEQPLSPELVLSLLYRMDTGHLYFLQIIIVLYLLTPFFARFQIHKNPWLVWGSLACSAGITAIVFQNQDWWTIYRTWFVYPFIFASLYLAGGYVNTIQRIRMHPFIVWFSIVVLISVSSISLLILILKQVSGLWYPISVFSLPTLFLSILAFVVLLKIPEPQVDFPWVRRIANWSFIIYIIHPFLLDILKRLVE